MTTGSGSAVWDWRAQRREIHLFPVLHLPDQQGRPERSYKAPGHSAGRSNVGFAPDKADVLARLGHIWTAHQSGHEIGSHGCGHFDGKDWSKTQWLDEFAQFDAELEKAWKNNGAEPPAGWAEFSTSAIKGFRAPYLSTGEGLFAALVRMACAMTPAPSRAGRYA
jgi:peptidoglycan/xylan/chitin deacetylase (PgdA/CDA1 family)